MRFSKEWSAWTPIQKALDGQMVGTGPGAYLIRVKGKQLHRAVGIDKLAIIDVGESGRLRARLRAFMTCVLNPGSLGHMAGWRFAYLKLGRVFPLEDLQVRWCEATDKAEATKLEAAIMTKYVSKHCELPPLNYKFNWALLAEK